MIIDRPVRKPPDEPLCNAAFVAYKMWVEFEVQKRKDEIERLLELLAAEEALTHK